MTEPTKIEPSNVAGELKELTGWEPEQEGRAISREFTFSNFYETIAFVNALAWVAHSMDHHPDLQVGYKTCVATYTTHSSGGLTSLDIEAARRLNDLISS